MKHIGDLFGNPIYQGLNAENEIDYNEILLEENSEGKIVLRQKQDDDLVVITGEDN